MLLIWVANETLVVRMCSAADLLRDASACSLEGSVLLRRRDRASQHSPIQDQMKQQRVTVARHGGMAMPRVMSIAVIYIYVPAQE